MYEGWLTAHGQNIPNADPLSYAREMMFGPTLEQHKKARKEYRRERRDREEMEVAQGLRQPNVKRHCELLRQSLNALWDLFRNLFMLQ